MNFYMLRSFIATLLVTFNAAAAEIHEVVKNGDTATLDRLLKGDHNLVNLPDDAAGMPPLLVAVEEGKLEMVTILLKAGAGVNARSADGSTPVLRAAGSSNQAGFAQVLARLFSEPTSRVQSQTYQIRLSRNLAYFSSSQESG